MLSTTDWSFCQELMNQPNPARQTVKLTADTATINPICRLRRVPSLSHETASDPLTGGASDEVASSSEKPEMVGGAKPRLLECSWPEIASSVIAWLSKSGV